MPGKLPSIILIRGIDNPPPIRQKFSRQFHFATKPSPFPPCPKSSFVTAKKFSATSSIRAPANPPTMPSFPPSRFHPPPKLTPFPPLYWFLESTAINQFQNFVHRCAPSLWLVE